MEKEIRVLIYVINVLWKTRVGGFVGVEFEGNAGLKTRSLSDCLTKY